MVFVFVSCFVDLGGSAHAFKEFDTRYEFEFEFLTGVLQMSFFSELPQSIEY